MRGVLNLEHVKRVVEEEVRRALSNVEDGDVKDDVVTVLTRIAKRLGGSLEIVENRDCFCNGTDCNVVRGRMLAFINIGGKYAVFEYYNHTQTDCETAGYEPTECPLNRWDIESLRFLGVYDSLADAQSAVC